MSIPEIQVPLSDDQFEQLKVSVNPFSSSEHHGIDLFLTTKSFVLECVA